MPGGEDNTHGRFESQKQKQAAELRRDANEKRKQELHRIHVSIAEAKADHQNLLNTNRKHSARANSAPENRPAQAA
jgi:hypothetical protein